MNTDHLIEALARDLQPAPALRRPWARAGCWLLGAVAYLGALTLVTASRADLAANGTGWRFVVPQLAAVLTAAASATAAFASTVPGFSRRILCLPAAAATLWLGSLVGGAVQEWSAAGAPSVGNVREWLCVAMIVLGSALPGAGMVLMLRKGAPLAPRVAVLLGALAVTALASVAACLSHPHPSSAVSLIWHGSTVLALVLLAAWGGGLLLTWDNRRSLARG